MILEIIKSEELLEPEYIREMLPDISDENFEWLMAARACVTSSYFFEDIPQFENICRALNYLPVDFATMQGIGAKHIWYSIDVVKRLVNRQLEFDLSIEAYTKYIFNEEGIWAVYPPSMDRIFDQSLFDTIFPISKDILNPEISFDIRETTTAHVQAQRLAEILIYTNEMKTKEII